MKYNTQTDKSWANEIMTSKEGSEGWHDTIHDWGCLVTSLSNIIQITQEKGFTPKDLNDVIKQIKGYRYLKDNRAKVEEASFLEFEVLLRYFTTYDIIRNVKEYKNDGFYIARVNHLGYGHYINVLSKQGNIFWCFDVWDGFVKSYYVKDIEFFHKVVIK